MSKSWKSKYKLVRHKHLGDKSGFIEMLEVRNPPAGKGRFFIHEYHARSQTSAFSEWTTLKNALNAFEQTGGFVLFYARKLYLQLRGHGNMTDCKPQEDPWFYET